MADITFHNFDLSKERFEEAITSLTSHGYISDTDEGKKVTKKGCLLAKEL